MVGDTQGSGRLDGKVVLITGGARGQGEAEARLFRANGADVWLTDVLDQPGQAVAADIGGHYLHHDVTDQSAWDTVIGQVLETRSRIDVLVNNAGIFQIASLAETDRDLWDTMIGVNQTGVYLGMRAVAPVMIEQKGGSIINISSIAGLRSAAAAFAYSATKWAVRGMTKGAAVELAPHGVRVNSIHPGIIDTAMIGEFDRAGVKDQVVGRIPSGRMGTANEVANLALFLASDESAYSTGSEFVVDGGMTA